jgi:Large eukaryotic DNA virus major capsid protein/Major capsid protein N-terminus
MGGGLLQLVAYGAQDAYLSGNPQITFWKGLFKRHTNFAMEPFRVNLTGQAAWGVKHSAILGRHADLLYSTYLEVVLPPGAEVNCDQGRLGYNLLKYVELDIGGQLIDRVYGEWMYLWMILSHDFGKGVANYNLVDGQLGANAVTVPPANQCANGRPTKPTILYIPLPFFYTKNPGAALPLIALQYHEVKINIEWNDAKFIAGNFNNAKTLAQPVQAAVYVDYIYLDTEERRRMAQQSHEYLIEQTQFNEDQGITSAQNRIDLTFNHPVKELVWVVQPEYYTNCSLMTEKGAGTRLLPFTYNLEAVYEQHLQINGQDRLDKRYGDYFHKVQPYQHHTGGNWDIGYTNYGTQYGIYCYSFALRPEEHQPSGTCNFSRIDTATIVLSMNGSVDVSPANPWNVRVYAINYNILRIMSGMGGLAYSN